MTVSGMDNDGSFHVKENLWHLIISTYFLVVVIDVQLPGNIISRHKVDIHDVLLSTRIYLKTSHLTLIINQSIAIALFKFDIFTF